MTPFRLGTAVAISYDENGMLGVQVDGNGNNAAGHGRYSIGTFGLIGRPRPANDQGGSHTLHSDEGDEGFAWCGFDNRDLDKVPALTDGSVAVYNSDGAHHLLDAVAQTSTLYVPVDDAAHMVMVGKSASGKKIIDILHANGSHFTLGEDDSIWRGNGNAFLRIVGDDITANGTFKGGSGDFGGGAGQPVVNATLLATVLDALAVPLNAAGVAPVVSSALGAALQAIAVALRTTAGTTMLKAL
jgi:hypothetical protein